MLCIFIAVISVFIVLGFCGCASNNYFEYNDLAKGHDFDYFFPSWSFSRNFDNVDEAYDYVKTAQAKFNSVVGKPLAKGLPGKLEGPVGFWKEPVKVFCFMQASNPSSINLAAAKDPLEKIMRDSISSTVVFLVFGNVRGVSLASYYLKGGWVYNTSSQHSSFLADNIKFGVKYPVGWSNEKAFRYIRKEID